MVYFTVIVPAHEKIAKISPVMGNVGIKSKIESNLSGSHGYRYFVNDVT
jgi:hypothetical protein